MVIDHGRKYLYIWFPNDTSFDVRNAVLTCELFCCLKLDFSPVCQVSFISNLRRKSVTMSYASHTGDGDKEQTENKSLPISSEDLTLWRTRPPRQATAWHYWSSSCWWRRTRWWLLGPPGSSWPGWACTSAGPPCPRPAPWPSCCWWPPPGSGCPPQSSRWSCLCWSHSGICQAGRIFPHQSLRSVNKTVMLALLLTFLRCHFPWLVCSIPHCHLATGVQWRTWGGPVTSMTSFHNLGSFTSHFITVCGW